MRPHVNPYKKEKSSSQTGQRNVHNSCLKGFYQERYSESRLGLLDRLLLACFHQFQETDRMGIITQGIGFRSIVDDVLPGGI